MKIEKLEPFGGLVIPDKEESIFELKSSSLEELVQEFQLLIFRGFPNVSESDFIQFAKQFGPLLKWDFGEVLNITKQTNPLNHIFDSGRIELHWDGAFVDETPILNLFQCLSGCDNEAGGETVFVNTIELLASFTKEERAQLDHLSLIYETEKKAHYGGVIQEPFISEHPRCGRDRIRFVEPFNEDNEKVNPVTVTAENYGGSDHKAFLMSIIEMLYDDSFVYAHRWHKGDFAIVDNNALLHGRHRFENIQTKRHLQRIHVL